jgi:hypothetical protein
MKIFKKKFLSQSFDNQWLYELLQKYFIFFINKRLSIQKIAVPLHHEKRKDNHFSKS